jgi:pimeloyl-ACP methyl ester carboxylesterase
MSQLIKIRIFLLFLLFLTLPVQALSAVESGKVRERMVREPVFGGQVLIQEAGRKGNPPLVLIHGLGDLASGTWQGLLPKLARDYHVVTFDLPGFGRSQKQNSLYSPGNYATFVKWVVDSFVGAPPIIVGHSLGGAIALRYAGTYPESLTRLVLVDAAGVLDRRVYTKEMLGVLAENFSVPISVDSFLGNMVGGLPNPLFDLDLMLDNAMLRQQLLGGDPEKIAAIALIQEDLSPYLFRIKVPTAIIWGEHDRVTPVRTGILLEANLPEATLRIIPGAGHMPMDEQPRLFAAAFSEALKGEYRPAARPVQGVQKTGRCEGTSGMVFEGDYESLEIVDCQDVHLRDIRARSVILRRSTAVFDRGEISGGDIGLLAEASTLIANGLKISAPVAVSASGSRLDLAGVHLIGERAAVLSGGRLQLFFSVSRIDSPHGSGTIHGLREMAAGEEL